MLNLSASCSIRRVSAGSYWWDGGAMFGVVPKTLWQKHAAADELNRIEAAFNCYLVEIDGRRILIETGGGVRHDERARDRMRLPDPPHVRNAVDAASVDLVVNTHLHWDHCGGNTVGDGDAAFPHARYIVQRGELLHAREQHPRDAVSYRAINYEPLVDSGALQLLDGDTDIVPGVQLRVMPGHNRDMMIAIVRAGGQTWCHFADLIPYAAQIAPTWVAAFDLFPMETIANKQEILTQASRDNWWVSFGHDPAIAFARVERSQKGFSLTACQPDR